jgi:hypothetical protein
MADSNKIYTHKMLDESAFLSTRNLDSFDILVYYLSIVSDVEEELGWIENKFMV